MLDRAFHEASFLASPRTRSRQSAHDSHEQIPIAKLVRRRSIWDPARVKFREKHAIAHVQTCLAAMALWKRTHKPLLSADSEMVRTHHIDC